MEIKTCTGIIYEHVEDYIKQIDKSNQEIRNLISFELGILRKEELCECGLTMESACLLSRSHLLVEFGDWFFMSNEDVIFPTWMDDDIFEDLNWFYDHMEINLVLKKVDGQQYPFITSACKCGREKPLIDEDFDFGNIFGKLSIETFKLPYALEFQDHWQFGGLLPEYLLGGVAQRKYEVLYDRRFERTFKKESQKIKARQ